MNKFLKSVHSKLDKDVPNKIYWKKPGIKDFKTEECMIFKMLMGHHKKSIRPFTFMKNYMKKIHHLRES